VQVLGLGLLDEAAMLLGKGISSCDGAAPGSMAGKAVGYRQAIEWILQVCALQVRCVRSKSGVCA